MDYKRAARTSACRGERVKARESGMPEEACWASFFDVEGALDVLLGSGDLHGDVVEFGCGYGTFTLPAARRTQGRVTALDIEAEMVALVRRKAAESGLENLRVVQRDFVADGSGLEAGSQAHALVFNLLHLEDPLALLAEAHRVLRPGGSVSVMHWRSDVATPRGPSLDIRPSPQQCAAWMTEAGFHHVGRVDLERSCPYHFGLVGVR